METDKDIQARDRGDLTAQLTTVCEWALHIHLQEGEKEKKGPKVEDIWKRCTCPRGTGNSTGDRTHGKAYACIQEDPYLVSSTAASQQFLLDQQGQSWKKGRWRNSY